MRRTYSFQRELFSLPRSFQVLQQRLTNIEQTPHLVGIHSYSNGLPYVLMVYRMSSHLILLNQSTYISRNIWLQTNGLKHSKTFINAYSDKHTDNLRALGRNGISILTRAGTGHCEWNKHIINLKLRESRECIFCHKVDETPLLFLTQCCPCA